jgi:hypothetical protein
MVDLLGKELFEIEMVPGSFIKVTEIPTETSPHGSQKRVLHMVCGNMFQLLDIEQADIIMLETEIPQVPLFALRDEISESHHRIYMMTCVACWVR